MSAEPGRKTAYSNDLRWRIVYQRIAMNLPLVKIHPRSVVQYLICRCAQSILVLHVFVKPCTGCMVALLCILCKRAGGRELTDKHLTIT